MSLPSAFFRTLLSSDRLPFQSPRRAPSSQDGGFSHPAAEPGLTLAMPGTPAGQMFSSSQVFPDPYHARSLPIHTGPLPAGCAQSSSELRFPFASTRSDRATLIMVPRATALRERLTGSCLQVPELRYTEISNPKHKRPTVRLQGEPGAVLSLPPSPSTSCCAAQPRTIRL